MKALDALKARLLEVDDLNSAAGLLRWDQTTYMPAGGAPARGRQLATLSRLAHERFVEAETGRLLDAAAQETSALPFDSDEASLVRVARRTWEQAVKVPGALVSEFQEHASLIYQAWTYYVFRRRVSASEFRPPAPPPAAAPDKAADQDAMRTTNREGRHV